MTTAQKDSISKFFDTLYGDDFSSYLSIWSKDSKKSQFFSCTQKAELAEYVACEAESDDVYFGVGLLKRQPSKGRGKSNDVCAIPCVWLDLDIQSDAHAGKKYPQNIKEAQGILKEFPLEPSFIIQTGHGMHCYWLFKELLQISSDEARKKANALSTSFQKCIIKLFGRHGYKLDNTSDLARVLRIPGTLNHKTKPPLSVSFLSKQKNIKRYTRKQIIEAIKEVNSKMSQGNHSNETVLNTNIFPQSQVGTILKRCHWMNHCYEDSRILSEPEWFYMLTVVAFCEDPLKWADQLSKNYPEYSQQETANKLGRIQKEHNASVSCNYIRNNFAEHCEDCTEKCKTPFALGIDNNRNSLERIGFVFDDDGKPKTINGNIFARYILSRKNLLYSSRNHFYSYQDGLWTFLNRNELSRMLRDLVHEFIPDFWTGKLERQYMEALAREADYVNELNVRHEFINLLNGIFNLQTFELMPYFPEALSTVRIPIQYDATATCPNFDAFLNDIFEGDKQLITVIEEILGYCLTADVSAQKAFFFYGKGANGKSLLAEILMNLVGKPNTSATSLADLENSFSRYELVGKLLNLSTENELSPSGLNTTAFKAIVVGDPIQVEKKFEQSFMYQPICKLLFLLNNLPYTRDRSWGFHRKILIIPFNKTFREDDPNTRNYEELKQELMSEMSGIMNRALAGLKRLQQNKFKFSQSQAINKILDEYKQSINPFLQFVEDMIEPGVETDTIANNVMMSTFKKWCEETGYSRLLLTGRIRIHNDIRDALRELNIAFKIGEGRISGGRNANGGQRYICGVRLKINKNPRLYTEDIDEFEALG